MKVGILGSGVVAQALAAGFIKYGHEVMLGTRSPEKLAEWKQKAGKGAQVGDFAQSAAFGGLIALAVKGTAAKEALKAAGAANLKGKTILDATNPIADKAPENGLLKFFTSLDDSLMEQLQKAVPEANFAKAFNTIGSALMVNPNFVGVKPSMFICGNSAAAKEEAGKIISQFGFEAEDMGG